MSDPASGLQQFHAADQRQSQHYHGGGYDDADNRADQPGDGHAALPRVPPAAANTEDDADDAGDNAQGQIEYSEYDS